ncbi:MAG: SgcJ/EcaC family oxidoreductase, partial [Saprospiraceae bacterium]|nr:SgcJ/EcaC family oxidoreductase [Saprospiraceae bacterium]
EQQPGQLDQSAESTKILASIDNWNAGWDSKDVELAISDYADDTDWTNAFGDRVRTKDELRQLLKEIFAMDFVMEGRDHYENEDVEFLSSQIALLRSTNIRTGQKWSDGSLMKDRHIHHLRVYQRAGDQWKIISHMINQANERD